MQVFPTAKHLASWTGSRPGNDQSAGRRRSGRTRKGSKWLDLALGEAAMAALRTKDTYLTAKYHAGGQDAATARPSARSSTISAPSGTALHPRAIQRPRQRLLPQARPRTHHRTPCHPARSPRTHRHAAGGGGSLNAIFLSDASSIAHTGGGKEKSFLISRLFSRLPVTETVGNGNRSAPVCRGERQEETTSTAVWSCPCL